MTQLPPTTLTHGPDDHHATSQQGRNLADRLRDGEEFAVTFGGQGTDWSPPPPDLFEETPDPAGLPGLVEESDRRIAPVARQIAAALPRPFEPQVWLGAEDAPSEGDLV